MTLPDNRLRFDATRIDFASSVGEVGQDHEQFPGPGTQPRYDWLKMWFIALLANQASDQQPTQYRAGTIWFDLKSMSLNIYNGSKWVPLSDVVTIGEETLTAWYADLSQRLSGAAPELTFSGHSTEDGVDMINIPPSIKEQIDVDNTKPFVYINGLLVDPRNTVFETTSALVLRNGVVLNNGDRFTVVVKNITDSGFHVPDVNVP